MSPPTDGATLAMSSSDRNSQPPRSASPDSQHTERPKRRAQRVSRACDFCHTRSIRCRPNDSGSGPCQSCVEYQRDCTYDRPSKKRGVKSTATRNSVSLQTPTTPVLPGAADIDFPLSAPNALDHKSMCDLAEIYFETIFPVFPFFHRQTLLRRLEKREYAHQAPLFACLLAMCALTVARIRDGALFSDKWTVGVTDAMPSPSTLAAAAQAAIPRDTRTADSLDYLRAVCLLALTSMQNGLAKDLQMWVGTYHMLARVNGLRDESKWPPGLGMVELEERRRVVWSMYNFEVFSAAVFETPITCREVENKVRYPSPIDDEVLDQAASKQVESVSSERGPVLRGADPSQSNWIQGWNFVIDLYRILEHAIDRRRERENKYHSRRIAKLFTEPYNTSSDSVLAEMQRMFSELPDCFKEVPSMTFDPQIDRFGFQSANIAATMQLVRITLYSPEVATDEQRCDIVRQVVQTFAEIPIGFLKAISTPLLYHLSGIGIYLGSVFRHVLTDSNYNRCRETLLGLADLLSNLGAGTLVGDEPSRRVRAQVDRMEAYMQTQILTPASSTRTLAHRENPATPCSLGVQDYVPVTPYQPLQDVQLHGQKVYGSYVGSGGASLASADSSMGNYGSCGHSLPLSQPMTVAGAQYGPSQGSFSSQMMDDWTWAFDLRQTEYECRDPQYNLTSDGD